jgi:hypothetical protein
MDEGVEKDESTVCDAPSRCVALEFLASPPPNLYHAQTGGYAQSATLKINFRFLGEEFKIAFFNTLLK